MTVNQRKTLFYLKVLLGNNFPLINAQVSKLVKVIKLRQNQFVNKRFS